ncbi:putative RNA-directed DNA polymerase from mobile element jockey-like [Apostichopus japonicus]|uniref:Putative RNA-directed DNA polymerase from mobile element jockey-like n=1 Tax=Stichopus japonicus TaxID=307972 RepID=A0A2G8K9G2_STIJA|nr:putative RNA-directed DNA polymerase from mobile element jockey-like [Apostichopus japonicus]
MKTFRDCVTFLSLIYCSSLVVQTWATMEIPVQLGGSVTLDCGFETTVTGRPLQWVTILPGKEPKPFAYSWEGASGCSEDDLCTLHPNGSLELHDISPKDVDRMYRCQIGDGEKYEYYSDHHLNVLVETCPLIKLSTATSAKGFKIDEQVMFSYTEPVCEDNAHGNYRATCYPPPGILMEGDYENIQCSCTDSACLTDRLNISIASTKMLKEKMQPLGIGLITIAVVLAIAVALVAAVFATYYTTSRLYKKNEKGTASSQESGVPNSTNNTQVTDCANEVKAVQHKLSGTTIYKVTYQLMNENAVEYLSLNIASMFCNLVLDVLIMTCPVKSDPVLPDHEFDEALANDVDAFVYNKVNTVTTSVENPSLVVLSDVGADCKSEFTSFEPVTESHIRKTIMACPSKSCKLDPIPTSLVKSCMDILLLYITHKKILSLHVHFQNLSK